jgi:NAD-dependent SIR2 family protein deacetylase
MAPGTSALGTFIGQARSLAVLSGAGVSTASGIPDYRDRNGDWKYSQPIQYGEFMRSADARRRYWSRSFVGWRRFAAAEPNAAHYAIARLEEGGKIDTVITQNVDGLHAGAGSRAVIDLHGDLGKVRCTACDVVTGRAEFQAELAAKNPGWSAEALDYRADGDVELLEDAAAEFTVPPCKACGGIVKPDVVMFGEAVPKERVASAMDAVDRADALLVVGTSLMVFSGFRFARRASEAGKAIAIINRGRTRADAMATLKVDDDCSTALPAAVAAAIA